MKADEVPQDDEDLFEGKFTLLQYALDDKGGYTQVGSKGWEARKCSSKTGLGRNKFKNRGCQAKSVEGRSKSSSLLYGKKYDGHWDFGRRNEQMAMAGQASF